MEKRGVIEENTTPAIDKREKKASSHDKTQELDNDLSKQLSDSIRDKILGKKSE